MRKILAALFLFASVAAASAQLTTTGAGKTPGAAPPPTCTYTGAGDIAAAQGVTVYAWFGLDAFSAATCGAAAIEVCQAGTTTCVDFVTSTTTGALVLGTPGGTNCTTLFSNCDIRKMYGQGGTDCSGACVATFSPRPYLGTNTTDCSGKSVCVLGNQVASVASITGTSGTHPQGVTMSVYARRVNGSTDCIAWSNGTTPGLAYTSANTVQMYSGSAYTNTVSDNAWHAMQAFFNGASSILNLDGTELTAGNTGASGYATAYGIGATTLCPLQRVQFTEVGFYDTTNATSRPAFATNMATRWP